MPGGIDFFARRVRTFRGYIRAMVFGRKKFAWAYLEMAGRRAADFEERVADARIFLVVSSRSPVLSLRNSFSARALRVAAVSPRRINISCVDSPVLLMTLGPRLIC